jgi:hypothetical protein
MSRSTRWDIVVQPYTQRGSIEAVTAWPTNASAWLREELGPRVNSGAAQDRICTQPKCSRYLNRPRSIKPNTYIRNIKREASICADAQLKCIVPLDKLENSAESLVKAQF